MDPISALMGLAAGAAGGGMYVKQQCDVKVAEASKACDAAGDVAGDAAGDAAGAGPCDDVTKARDAAVGERDACHVKRRAQKYELGNKTIDLDRVTKARDAAVRERKSAEDKLRKAQDDLDQARTKPWICIKDAALWSDVGTDINATTGVPIGNEKEPWRKSVMKGEAQHCAAKCSSFDACKGFSLEEKTRLCWLKSTTRGVQQGTGRTKGFYFCYRTG